ncbi:MAG: thioredoxin [Nitrospirae bacterium]|nr:thioredoxin [Nitrospirota bacterium]MBI4838398.1 thioredoxin [Nitrospirota bacterium]
MSENITNVNAESWDKEVVQTPGVVMVDFWATWCGPCKTIAPTIEELAKEYTGKAKFVKVNTDENPDLASRYKITGIPTLIFFKDGQPKEHVVGAVPKAHLKTKLDSLL